MNEYRTTNLWHQQGSFIFFFALFLLLGGSLLLFIDKGELILFFNVRRALFFDVFFSLITRFGEAIMYITALILFIYDRRYSFAISVPVLAVIVTIVSFVLKRTFAHARPITFFQSENLTESLTFVEGVYINKGATSFPSGHTMSAFAICFFIALAFPYRRYLSGVLFVLALFVGISRVYLVQHFFEDVYIGALIGVVLALLIYTLTLRIQGRFQLDKNSRILRVQPTQRNQDGQQQRIKR